MILFATHINSLPHGRIYWGVGLNLPEMFLTPLIKCSIPPKFCFTSPILFKRHWHSFLHQMAKVQLSLEHLLNAIITMIYIYSINKSLIKRKRVMCTKLTTMHWGMEHCKHGVEWQHFASWHDLKGLHCKSHFSLSIVEYEYFVASRHPTQTFHQRSAKSGEPLEQHYTNQYGKFQ